MKEPNIMIQPITVANSKTALAYKLSFFIKTHTNGEKNAPEIKTITVNSDPWVKSKNILYTNSKPLTNPMIAIPAYEGSKKQQPLVAIAILRLNLK